MEGMMSGAGNLFADLPLNLAEEVFEKLLSADNVRLERIVSHGHASPPDFWYDQEQHEWILIVQGEARLRIGSDTVEMRTGDYVNIPAHTRHRVDWTTPDSPTIWLAIHYV
jgi:cupin 2 domain-containing protein